VADSLPDETILIRGGENKVTDVKKAAEEAASTSDEGHVLSGNADPSLDLDGLLLAARHPHARISKSTVGRVRTVGCEVSPPTGKKRHVTIVLPQSPTDDDYERFVQARGERPASLRRTTGHGGR
jgi:hypothetical protein